MEIDLNNNNTSSLSSGFARNATELSKQMPRSDNGSYMV